ncbi:hypothetical protein JCM6292_737 [Bacteroides pyogenes JCM 6292]|uniref:Uncharacterized protein n=2 Tax=Bacteroides pyogenes TaxID=310300 RepID=W4PGF5_9BACE|nr:hypothetical protein [Bacteroides pyogenes]GAE14579.1 hypothetical protein JCM6292_737 [Bacteroides pyogenes JCM 6292]GAE18249.1 hypothetical protein JCM6294_1122 [Bacteroides pyogenes DSM 20611 = JCM 6294]
MKKVIALVLWIVLLVLLTSCSATKKATRTKEMQLDSVAVAKEVTERTEKVVDTTRTEHGKVTITEIEFYPPTTTQPQGELANHKDSSKKTSNETKPMASIELNDIGKMQGVVKSIRQTVIQSDVQEKGESKESRESDNSENAATMSKQETNMDKQQEPTPDPKRWRYIFYIIAIGALALLYLKRVPVLNWIKGFLLWLHRIFIRKY